MSIEPWTILSQQPIQIVPYRKVIIRRYLLPNGREAEISLKDEGAVVTIFAITPLGNILMCRQYRPGPNLVLDELPAGRVDDNEEPLAAAQRELLEETGYASDEWTFLGKPLECAYSTIARYAFMAKRCYLVGDQDLDPLENIDVLQKSIPDLLLQLEAGLLTDPEVAWMGLWKIGAIKSISGVS